MADRDWDKELAKVDKQLAALSDDALLGPTPVQLPGRKSGSSPSKPASRASVAAPAASAPKATSAIGVYARVLLAVALGAGIVMWPYPARCGLGLAGYLGAIGIVVAGGLWAAVWTWRHRASRSHTLSLLIVLWGLVLGARQILPRVGYGKPDLEHPAGWACQQAPAPASTPAPATTPAVTPAATPPATTPTASPTTPPPQR